MIRYTLLAALLFSNAGALASTSQKEKDSEAALLVQRAGDLSDIRRQGAVPFRLKADISVTNDDGSVERGTYTEFWISREKWRREAVLGEVRWTQVVLGRKSWSSDSSAVALDRISTVIATIDPWPPLLDPWKTDKFETQQVSNSDARCFRTKREPWGPAELCFEKDRGALVARIKLLQVKDKGVNETCIYKEYRQFGDKWIPTSYECYEQKKLWLAARVSDFIFHPEPDPSLFTPLAEGKEFAHCPTQPQPPRVIYNDAPALMEASSAMVKLTLQVGTDGNPHDLRIVKSANKMKDDSVLEYVRRWKFKPALCEGQPMEAEIAVEVDSRVIR